MGNAAMGNLAAAAALNQAQCCAVKDSEADKQATTDTADLIKAEAIPVLDEPVNASSAVAVTEHKKEKEDEVTYTVTLDKNSGGKLGLDVDYMAERKVLPIMSLTGGLAEQWNQDNHKMQLKRGDSILEVNGVRGNVAVMLERCKTEKVLTLLLARNFTHDHLVADLESLVAAQGCGPLLIRLSFSDAAAFAEGKGGCPNAAMRFTDGGESTFRANAGLPTAALTVLKPISDKYCTDLISHADLWALAANVAIRVMGGPSVATRFGRVDAKSSEDSAPSLEGRWPDGDKGADHLRAIFHAKNFDDKAIVALSGAHTVGRCHADRSGFDGTWTEQPLKFDNGYFKELISKSYTAETTAKGCPQHRHEASRTIMLPSDLALLQDSSFEAHVQAYAKDQDTWFADFAVAWKKFQECGCDNLRDSL